MKIKEISKAVLFTGLSLQSIKWNLDILSITFIIIAVLTFVGDDKEIK